MQCSGSDTLLGSVNVAGSIAILLVIGIFTGAAASSTFHIVRARRRRLYDIEYRERFGAHCLKSEVPDVSGMVKSATTPSFRTTDNGVIGAHYVAMQQLHQNPTYQSNQQPEKHADEGDQEYKSPIAKETAEGSGSLVDVPLEDSRDSKKEAELQDSKPPPKCDASVSKSYTSPGASVALPETQATLATGPLASGCLYSSFSMPAGLMMQQVSRNKSHMLLPTPLNAPSSLEVVNNHVVVPSGNPFADTEEGLFVHRDDNVASSHNLNGAWGTNSLIPAIQYGGRSPHDSAAYPHNIGTEYSRIGSARLDKYNKMKSRRLFEDIMADGSLDASATFILAENRAGGVHSMMPNPDLPRGASVGIQSAWPKHTLTPKGANRRVGEVLEPPSTPMEGVQISPHESSTSAGRDKRGVSEHDEPTPRQKLESKISRTSIKTEKSSDSSNRGRLSHEKSTLPGDEFQRLSEKNSNGVKLDVPVEENLNSSCDRSIDGDSSPKNPFLVTSQDAVRASSTEQNYPSAVVDALTTASVGAP